MPVTVCPVLRYENLGVETAQQLWHNRVDRTQIPRVSNRSWNRNVDGVAFCLWTTDIVGKTCARKQQQTGFVDRDGEHSGVIHKCLLDAIAVMRVEIDIGDTLSTLIQHVLNEIGRASCREREEV